MTTLCPVRWPLTVHASIVRELPLAQHEPLARVVETDVLGLAASQDARPVGGVAHGRETLAGAGFLRCWCMRAAFV